jgi:hypothetical protein
MLILKPGDRADSFVVALDSGKQVGRIFKSNAAPANLPWGWTIQFLLRRGSGPHLGFEPTRDDAMKAFQAAWNSLPP